MHVCIQTNKLLNGHILLLLLLLLHVSNQDPQVVGEGDCAENKKQLNVDYPALPL